MEGLIELMEIAFARLNERGVKLSPGKCQLFQTEVEWCGRLISADGVRHKPERLEAMKNFAKPTDAGQLLSFTAALNWMRPHLMEYSPQIQPLYMLLEV